MPVRAVPQPALLQADADRLGQRAQRRPGAAPCCPARRVPPGGGDQPERADRSGGGRGCGAAHAGRARRRGGARDARPARHGSAAEPGAADEIIAACARLPLALGIAVGRAAARPKRPLTELAAELHDARGRLDALDAGDAPTSVRAVFSWSYENLTGPAARMFRLLGVHPGPDITAPAAASLAAVPLDQARKALDELASAHLVAEQPPGRYHLHDLLRAYAVEQVRASEPEGAQAAETDRAAAEARLLDHYLHTAMAASNRFSPFRSPLQLACRSRACCPPT